MNVCEATIAGHCTSWSPFRVFMVTSLWSVALLMVDRWWMEVSADE